MNAAHTHTHARKHSTGQSHNEKKDGEKQTVLTRPSALGMSDPVMEFLGILETQEFPIILKLLKGTKGA